MLLEFLNLKYANSIIKQASTTIRVPNGNSGVTVKLELLTAIGVPVNSLTGKVPDTVSGEVKVVATETQLSPSQYEMTLWELKLGSEIEMKAIELEPRDESAVTCTS